MAITNFESDNIYNENFFQGEMGIILESDSTHTITFNLELEDKKLVTGSWFSPIDSHYLEE